MRSQVRVLASLLGALLFLTLARPAEAQNTGFQVNRYEPTAAGEWSLWVDHPWYSRTRYFAADVTLNYGHQPLVFGYVGPDGKFNTTYNAIAHQLIGHIDLAGSFLDRVLISLSMPITLLERGEPGGGVTPAEGVAAGDPRLGVFVRLYGQPYASKFSLSVGGLVWLPLRRFTDSIPATESDQEFRGLPKIVLGGLASRVMWSFTAGVLIRPDAAVGNVTTAAGRTTGNEFQSGFAIAYANTDLRLAIGPELVFATALNGNAFQPSYSSLEALLGIHYNIAHTVQLSLGGGVGVLRQPGTPDSRFLLRFAYAPMKKPVASDRDGIPDAQDGCPDEPKGSQPDPEQLGCPLRDRDGDGVFDRQDLCPDTPQGDHPEPSKPGCPQGDRDGDDVRDREDLCPDEPHGSHPDPAKLGCPQRDRDGDGVFDGEDQCPDTAKGDHPDPARPGCPAGDRDGDGVHDPEDRCPDEPKGAYPDPARPGCPLSDRDHDTVPDAVDACPDQPGAPSPDPKKNGCPGLVEVKDGQIVIMQPVFFATDKDQILKQSFPVLQSVADALKVSAQIKKVRVEGHTDDRGKEAHNIDLSDRRAKSVLQWLVQHDIEPGRLEAQGFGPKRPIADNKKPAGRAKNRRVDFVILDPARVGAAPAALPAETKGVATKVEPVKTAAPTVGEKTEMEEEEGKGHKHLHHHVHKHHEKESAAEGESAPAQPTTRHHHHRSSDN